MDIENIPLPIIAGAFVITAAIALTLVCCGGKKEKKPDKSESPKKVSSSAPPAPTAAPAALDAAAVKGGDAGNKKKKNKKKGAEISSPVEIVPQKPASATAAVAAAPKVAEKKEAVKQPEKPKPAPASIQHRTELSKVVSGGANTSTDLPVMYSRESIDNFEYYETDNVTDPSDGWTEVETSKKGKKIISPASIPKPTLSSSGAPLAIQVAAPALTVSSDDEELTPVAAEKQKSPVDTKETTMASAATLVLVPESVRREVRIDPKKVGFIIGPKGATLRSIESATECEITMPKTEKDAINPVPVIITGPNTGVQKAEKAIRDLVNKGYSALIASEGFQENSISIPIKSIPDVIGRNGTVIKSIQDTFQVKLFIPDTSNRDPSIQKVRITVAGNKELVAKAKAVIKEITQYFYSLVTHPDYTHEELDIPEASYSYVIGPKGSEIRHIQASYKVSVHIPNSDTFVQKVLVVGQAPAVAKAKAYIEKLLERVQTRREEYEAARTKDDTAEDDQPQEEWMEKYTYKRQTHVPSPPKAGGPMEMEVPIVAASGVAVSTEAKPTWSNVAATAEGWYQNGNV